MFLVNVFLVKKKIDIVISDGLSRYVNNYIIIPWSMIISDESLLWIS